ncbi:hypothetical protein GCM10010472_40530 [Pseudonocardia halophobica]|uniref:SalK n=1 Tax=Pseudonocardia halophobica TaxID=29401 RepID=A0A9W6P091_9PSEU|nr:hypothetical protein [Pseudonocardia halophobica]GLL15461.1 hypothetical protein GCM10017577_66120 [Pseudonocardia halophobica]
MAGSVTVPARRLAGALEPVVGQVYFAPEAHEAYEKLGFGGSPRSLRGVAAPDGPAYFCSRGSVLGQVPGEVVASAFGVFNPEAVVPAVAHGWTLTDAATICEARTDAARAQLVRILGERPEGLDRARDLLERAVAPLRPEGKALFAGLQSLGLPGDPVADVWRLGDLLREYRGDAHIAAWTSAGFDATEIGLLTEPYWGVPLRSYVRSRAWTTAQLDAAEERLVARGLLADGALTDRGREEREAVEVATDRMCEPIVRALGADVDTLVDLLRPWGRAVREAQGYPASGPHDLAGS